MKIKGYEFAWAKPASSHEGGRMRSFLKQFSHVLLIGVVMLGMGLVFQNCAGYKAPRVGTSVNASSSCTESDPGCSSPGEALRIAIGNLEPDSILPSQNALDVSGWCDLGGYSLGYIYYSLRREDGSVPAGYTRSAATESSEIAGTCDDMGRFRIAVGIPPAHESYKLVVRLVGQDASGGLHENPLGQNKAEHHIIPAATAQ